MLLDYKGIHINYFQQGHGEVIVLLHGFLENSTIWNPFLPHFGKNTRIITIDLLGHGQTGCLGYIHSMETMAEAVIAVLTELEVTKAAFIAHSMGGYVALALVEINPKMLKGLCLVNSTAKADSSERKKNRDRAIVAVKQNHKSFIRIAIGNLFRPKNRKLFSKKISILKEEALKMPLQGIIAALEGMKIRPNREQVLRNISATKIMFISKKDPVLKFDELLKEAKDNMVKTVEFPDGHMSYIENESLFLRNIMHFIEYL